MFAKRNVSFKALSAFLSFFLASSLFFVVLMKNKSDVDRAKKEQLLVSKSIKINEVISKLLYKTHILAAFIRQGEGSIDNFQQIAPTIVDDPAILNVLIAPGGVISEIYPLKGNEQAVNYNLLGEGAGNKEAVMAKDAKSLIFGGPFELIQGGQALVGRLPVYLEQPDGSERFWGLVSVTLKYPDVLQGVGLDELTVLGLDYEIWRISPDTNARQVIAGSSQRNENYLEKHIPIMNSDWYFRILAVKDWYQYPEFWALSLVGLVISLMIGFIVQNNITLDRMKTDLEGMVRTDPLTELLNRKGLFHEVERLIRLDKKFLLYYLDLDAFKQINDTYGHNVGDLALKEFSRAIDKYTDGSHILARISGDEFVLVHVDASLTEENMQAFWENMEKELSKEINVANNCKLKLRFSRGVARYPLEGRTIDELIYCADQKMYKEKCIKKLA